MKLSKKYSILAAAAVSGLGIASAAHAAAFVNLQVLASATANGTYTSTLTVTPGETVFYEVVGQLAASGTVNTQHPYTLGTQASPGNGIDSLGLNVSQTDGTVTGITSALGAGWNGATGATAGTASGSTVSDAFAGQASGAFVAATTTSIILSGSFLAGSASTDTVGAGWSTDVNAGGIKVLTTVGAKPIQLSNTTESNVDPYVGDTALVLSEESESVPAPGVVPALGALVSGLGIIGLVRRRRMA